MKWFKVICFILLTSTIHCQKKIRSLILDTDGKHEYYYRTLKELAHTCNINCSYKNIYSMLESPTINNTIDALFFFASPRLVMQHDHELSQEILRAVKTFAQDNNKLIVFLLPNYAPPEKIAALLKNINLPANVSPHAISSAYLKVIGHPNAQSGKQYGTSLINKSNVSSTQRPTLSQLPHNVLLLPRISSAGNAQSVNPLAISVYNKEKNNLIALVPATDVTFADIAENFHKNPHAMSDRNNLLEHVQQLLWELSHLHTTHKLPQKNKPALPTCFMPKQHTSQKSLSAAWLEPKDFYLHELPTANDDSIRQACANGCTFLSNCNFDLLWFEVNPEWYFSPMALFKKDTDKVMTVMKNIGMHLKKPGNYPHQKTPQIFIGSDITSNFNGQNPQHCAYDLYGTAYPNVPSPLDVEHLWKQELIDTFKECHNQLKNDVSIDGLFLDFEMYHAPKQASSYHDLMDFSECAWQVFKHAHPTAPDCKTVKERVAYLKNNKLFDAYFRALTHKAKDIGQLITQQLKTINPRLRVAVYAPTLPSSWFYRGLWSGLSSTKDPLSTATFNTDYHLHKEWLTKQDIHLQHGSALMMSKLQHTDDFDFIKKLSDQHDFIWYNRPSRQLYQKIENGPSGKWWQAEYSTLENNIIANGIKSLHTQSRNNQ